MNSKFKIDPRVYKDYYSADYFIKTREILTKYKKDQIVTMQWFQRNDNIVVCGIEMVLHILKNGTDNYDELEIYALNDGDIINAKEPVLKITGRYQDFAHLEGVIDGLLSRASSVATNCREMMSAANGKTIINMNDRADSYVNQQIDGYASYVGGMKKMVSPASLEYIDDDSIETPQGTMPHALIQAFEGNVLEAAKAYKETFKENPLTVLIDYNNDCITDALIVAEYFKDELKAVRVDTSEALIDKSLLSLGDKKEYHGVNPTLIKNLRKALDEKGYKHVKIIASSGFDVEKIKWFEAEQTPVDIYGVGEAITKKRTSFTGDAVLINGIKQSKFGRENYESERIKRVK